VAITAATVTGDFSGFLTPDRADAIFERAAQMSVVQALARRVPLGISGVDIPVVTTKPSAGWVAEGGQKPATKGAMSLKTMSPKKLAAIAVVSAEVVRANPGNYVDLFRNEIAEAFAIAFDAAALHGTATPFTTYIDQTTKTRELGTAAASAGGVYADLVAAMKLLTDDSKRLTGFAFDSRAEPVLLASVDTAGRPIFVDTPPNDTVLGQGRVLGRRTFIGDGVYGSGDSTVGYAGDWTQCAWGSVGGITYDVSTEATVTINGLLTSLWEKNLVAIRAEAEYGFLCNDTAAFVQLLDAA
jgi:HK97 family phage major capsid protein